MYREADGADDVRRAVREQLRHGRRLRQGDDDRRALGRARGPRPGAADARRRSRRSSRRRTGWATASRRTPRGWPAPSSRSRTGVDTIEHGMYLHQRPDLLERMAAQGQVLVPTLSCFYGVAGIDEPAAHGARRDVDARCSSSWREHNLEQADRTLKAAPRRGRARSRSATTGTRSTTARSSSSGWSITACRRRRRSSPPPRPARRRSGSATQLGTVEPGRLADLRGRRRRPAGRPAAAARGASGSGSCCSSASRSPAPRSRPTLPR